VKSRLEFVALTATAQKRGSFDAASVVAKEPKLRPLMPTR
jgi:hypothetical protein